MLSSLKRKSKYWGIFGRYARRRCPHSMVDGIFGAPVDRNGGWRLWCRGCRRYLNGPVQLAAERATEGEN